LRRASLRWERPHSSRRYEIRLTIS
jgi:hypothetical protein